jgi:hypothetical protein
MKKLKDIYYDLNDIMVAVIIVAIAALVIVTNIDSILNYPSGIATEIQTPEKQTPTTYAENPPITNEGGADTTSGQGTTDAAVGGGTATGGGVTGNTGTGEVVNYSVYINPGETGDQIADKMIGVGLFKDRQQFHDAVAAAGADGKLRAGNFIIPSDSTPAEVISIITQ